MGKLCLFFHLLEAPLLGSILRRPVGIMFPFRTILIELHFTDKKTRDKAIKNLSLFLSDGQNVISKPDMDKLWKGIFYCGLTQQIFPAYCAYILHQAFGCLTSLLSNKV